MLFSVFPSLTLSETSCGPFGVSFEFEKYHAAPKKKTDAKSHSETISIVNRSPLPSARHSLLELAPVYDSEVSNAVG